MGLRSVRSVPTCRYKSSPMERGCGGRYASPVGYGFAKRAKCPHGGGYGGRMPPFMAFHQDYLKKVHPLAHSEYDTARVQVS